MSHKEEVTTYHTTEDIAMIGDNGSALQQQQACPVDVEEPIIPVSFTAVYSRQDSKFLTEDKDEDGDDILDPVRYQPIHVKKGHHALEGDHTDIAGDDDWRIATIFSGQEETVELVESKKTILKICRNSKFIRIESRILRQKGKKPIKCHYITNPEKGQNMDVTGDTGLRPRDELLKLNGTQLKYKTQPEVKRMFARVKADRNRDIKMSVQVRRWFAAKGPSNEREWDKVKVITFAIELGPEPGEDKKAIGSTIKNIFRRQANRLGCVREFRVLATRSAVDRSERIKPGAIKDINKKGTRIMRLRLPDGKFVSNNPMPDNSVDVSVLNRQQDGLFNIESFNGFNMAPNPIMNEFLFCARIQTLDEGFFLTSNIGEVNADESSEVRDVRLLPGADDFDRLDENNIDERCFRKLNNGSSTILQSLLYREWYVAHDREEDKLYMKYIPMTYLNRYIEGPAADGYVEAERKFSNCQINFFRLTTRERITRLLLGHMCGRHQ